MIDRDLYYQPVKPNEITQKVTENLAKDKLLAPPSLIESVVNDLVGRARITYYLPGIATNIVRNQVTSTSQNQKS